MYGGLIPVDVPDVARDYENMRAEVGTLMPALQQFGEVIDDLVEGWTMLVPFCESSRNFATTPPAGPEDGCYVSGPGC